MQTTNFSPSQQIRRFLPLLHLKKKQHSPNSKYQFRLQKLQIIETRQNIPQLISNYYRRFKTEDILSEAQSVTINAHNGTRKETNQNGQRYYLKKIKNTETTKIVDQKDRCDVILKKIAKSMPLNRQDLSNKRKQEFKQFITIQDEPYLFEDQQKQRYDRIHNTIKNKSSISYEKFENKVQIVGKKNKKNSGHLNDLNSKKKLQKCKKTIESFEKYHLSKPGPWRQQMIDNSEQAIPIIEKHMQA